MVKVVRDSGRVKRALSVSESKSHPLIFGALVVFLLVAFVISLFAFAIITFSPTIVNVYVVDTDGQPVSDAIVEADFGAPGVSRGTTDNDGFVRISVGYQPSKLVLTAGAEGYETNQEAYGLLPYPLSVLVPVPDLKIKLDKAAVWWRCLPVTQDMGSTYLISPNGYPARACEVRVSSAWDTTKAFNLGWRADSAGTLIISDPKGDCPSMDDLISIKCDGLSYHETIANFLEDIKIHNSITLTSFD
jgi:hypothetical protein